MKRELPDLCGKRVCRREPILTPCPCRNPDIIMRLYTLALASLQGLSGLQAKLLVAFMGQLRDNSTLAHPMTSSACLDKMLKLNIAGQFTYNGKHDTYIPFYLMVLSQNPYVKITADIG